MTLFHSLAITFFLQNKSFTDSLASISNKTLHAVCDTDSGHETDLDFGVSNSNSNSKPSIFSNLFSHE